MKTILISLILVSSCGLEIPETKIKLTSESVEEDLEKLEQTRMPASQQRGESGLEPLSEPEEVVAETVTEKAPEEVAEIVTEKAPEASEGKGEAERPVKLEGGQVTRPEAKDDVPELDPDAIIEITFYVARSRTVNPNISLAGLSHEILDRNFDLLLSEHEDFEGAVETSFAAPEFTFEDEGMNTLYAKATHKETGVVYEGSGQIQSVIPVKDVWTTHNHAIVKKEDLSWVSSAMAHHDDMKDLNGKDVDIIGTGFDFAWTEDGAFHLVGDKAYVAPVAQDLAAGVIAVTVNENSFRVEKKDRIILLGEKFLSTPVVILKKDILSEASSDLRRVFLLSGGELKTFGPKSYLNPPNEIPSDANRVYLFGEVYAVCGESCLIWGTRFGSREKSCIEEKLANNPIKVDRTIHYVHFLLDKTVSRCDWSGDRHLESDIEDFYCGGLQCLYVKSDGSVKSSVFDGYSLKDETDSPFASAVISWPLSFIKKLDGSLVLYGWEPDLDQLKEEEEKLKQGYDGLLVNSSYGLTFYKKDSWIVSTDQRFDESCDDRSEFEAKVSWIKMDEAVGAAMIVTSDRYLYHCGFLLGSKTFYGKTKPLREGDNQ